MQLNFEEVQTVYLALDEAIRNAESDEKEGVEGAEQAVKEFRDLHKRVLAILEISSQH